MIKRYSFFKRQEMEEEIDLAECIFAMMCKWRRIIAIGCVGLVLGVPVGILQAKNSGLHVEDLAPGIKAKLDAFASQALLNNQLNEDAAATYIMSLDPKGIYYKDTIQFVVRTDNYEDAQLASGYLNVKDDPQYLEKLVELTGYEGYIDNLSVVVDYATEVSEKPEQSNGMTYLGSGSVSGGDNSEAVDLSQIGEDKDAAIAILQEALNKAKASKSTDISEILPILNEQGQSYAKLTYTVSYLTKEQMDEFSPWLIDYVKSLAEEYCSGYSGFKLKLAKSSTLPLQSSNIQNQQQQIQTDMATRTAQTDVDVSSFLANAATTVTVNGVTTAAIIKSEEKEAYEQYWISITDPEYTEEISKTTVAKWMIIVGVVLAFLWCCYEGCRYLFAVKRVSENRLREDYNLDIIGYSSEGRKKMSALDKALSPRWVRMHACDWKYISNRIIKSLGTDENVILIHSSEERSIEPLLSLLAGCPNKVIDGDITTSEKVAKVLAPDTGVYLVVEPGKTAISSLESELHAIEMNELVLKGVILV